MSGGVGCHCSESKKPVHQRRWKVRQRRCNHSAFNGYRHTASDYSKVVCYACGMAWRTKAGYVDELLDETDSDFQEFNLASAHNWDLGLSMKEGREQE